MKIRMVVEYDNDAKIEPGDTAMVEKMLEQEKYTGLLMVLILNTYWQ